MNGTVLPSAKSLATAATWRAEMFRSFDAKGTGSKIDVSMVICNCFLFLMSARGSYKRAGFVKSMLAVQTLDPQI
jgi:hypothetical protein